MRAKHRPYRDDTMMLYKTIFVATNFAFNSTSSSRDAFNLFWYRLADAA